MASTERTVAKGLGLAHATLLEDLRSLEEVARSRSRGVADLSDYLVAIRKHVTEHFRLEEQNGYMDVVRTREPRLERAIQQLSAEHRQLLASLETLINEANAAVSLDNTLREKVRDWVERVRQHEARETDLVQEAFTLDLGAED